MTFEAKIAYFFGVEDQKPVVCAYLDALKKLEELGSNSSKRMLEEAIIPYLENAYQSIAFQRNWHFNPRLAAQIEFEVILGNAKGASFEMIKDLMVQLYSHIFQSNSPSIQKAAWLRTFLYQYKAEVLKREGEISLIDQSLMLELAKTSESFLTQEGKLSGNNATQRLLSK